MSRYTTTEEVENNQVTNFCQKNDINFTTKIQTLIIRHYDQLFTKRLIPLLHLQKLKTLGNFYHPFY